MVTPNTKKLRRLRDEKGMSQPGRVLAAGILRKHLKRVDAGCHDLAVGIGQRLAKAFGVTLAALQG